MKLYRHTGNIKAGLFILGVTIVIGLLAYTQILVNDLRKDNRQIVRLYAGLIANVVKDDSDEKWLIDSTEKWCQDRAIYNAIYNI